MGKIAIQCGLDSAGVCQEAYYIKVLGLLEEHCALAFGSGVYDVTGRIPARNFYMAGPREISFMQKNYIPRFDTGKREQYLAERGIYGCGQITGACTV